MVSSTLCQTRGQPIVKPTAGQRLCEVFKGLLWVGIVTAGSVAIILVGSSGTTYAVPIRSPMGWACPYGGPQIGVDTVVVVALGSHGIVRIASSGPEGYGTLQ